MMRTIAFFSYARHDDKAVGKLLSKIRAKLESEIQAYAGDADLEVFQDTDDIEPGVEWKKRLRGAIDNSAFFIPVITPFYFSRPACRQELEIWLLNYKSADERRRIMPIKFLPLPSPGMDKKTGKPTDKLREQIDGLQYVDFTSFRNNRILRGNLSSEISKLAELIVRRMK
jgi:cobaltochelatase CobT